MTKRKLSSGEGPNCRGAPQRSGRRSPKKMISVRVEEETNEEEEPVVWVHYIGERQSKDWKRNDP